MAHKTLLVESYWDGTDNADQFPIAAAMQFGHVRHDPDLISPKLPALHFW